MDFTTPANTDTPSQTQPAADEIVGRVQVICEQALETGRPLELEPTRSKLFDVFADANRSGLTGEGAAAADELTRQLGKNWGLDQSAQKSVADQQKLSENDLAKMRLLWSAMRMWMEWDYAWSRWKREAATGDGKGSHPNRPR